MKRTIIILLLLTSVTISLNISTKVYADKPNTCDMGVEVRINGTPTSGIEVKAHDYQGGPTFSCTTDMYGMCSITGLSSGVNYKVAPAVPPSQSCPTIENAVCGNDYRYVFACTEP